MPIKLSLPEKCYLVALFGDISMEARERVFSISSMPAQAGPLVMQEGWNFIGHLDNGRIAVKKRGRNRSYRVLHMLQKLQ
jgi:hypothetical protein